MPCPDGKDLKILALLMKDAKLTTHQIFKKTGIPPTTAHNRIRRMEALGIITGYTAVPDYKRLGKPVSAFISVGVVYNLPDGQRIRQEEVACKIRSLEGVAEVAILAGVTDILVRVRVRDIDELNDFVVRRLRGIAGVDRTETMVVLSDVEDGAKA